MSPHRRSRDIHTLGRDTHPRPLQAAFAVLAVSVRLAHSHTRSALFLVAAAALLLLFIGFHNAWDAVTYHVFVRRGQDGGTEPASKTEEE